MKDINKIFSPDNCNDEDSVIIKESMKCLSRFSDAFNREDLSAMDKQLNFPHILFSGNKYIEWKSSGQMPIDFFDKLKSEGWVKTVCELAEPLLISPNKIHFRWNYTRRDINNNVLSTHQNIWIVTNVNGKWGISFRSY